MAEIPVEKVESVERVAVESRREECPRGEDDVDTEAYEKSHAPEAIGFNWETDLQDQTRRDILGKGEFEELLGFHGIDGDETTVAYCRIGERSSVAWFALHELLGYEDSINYDGSWTEWGNLVGAPIETGSAGS